ncbi:DUF1800 domain-containing protein [Paractinoplanes ferrugineus]|uniref:DUF1800 domain-containing protein n=1 Tax=Paractinoplanes ferrugineus TaxID=113564 RepID=A0A919MH38_9ACTN|nr:DUF1800 domain-containing protein [Actinoplanes ferrugineus]GIE14524.1 hypothetical protein Afe05nite_63640 [Actinoplanes ferrugineus]
MTTRRTLLAAAGATTAVVAVGGGAAAAAPPSAAPQSAAQLGLAADPIAHLLRRATFGPTPATLAEAARLGVDGWLDRQLAPEKISDAECDALVARLPLAGASIATVRAKLPVHSYEAVKQLGRAGVARAAWSNRQLFESMAAFWANHLHVAAPSSGGWDSRADYDAQVLRKHSFGKFAELLKASMRHPAMLTYLDNRSSIRTQPNENYARELMELHTVGLIYTEDDVKAAARLLTGLTVAKDGGYAYDPSKHLAGAVEVLGFTDPNAAGDAGPLAFADYLARHPATARRIATKLCVRFVADDAPASLVARLAKIYLDNDTAVKPVLRALFTSPEFAAATGQKTRTPFEDLIATIRTLGLGPEKSGTGALDALYHALVDIGHAPYRWGPPNGYPDVAPAWASPSVFLLKCNWHLNLAAGWYPSTLTRPADLRKALVPTLPATYGAFLDALAVRLVGTKLPATHTAAVLSVAGKLPTSPLTSSDKSLAGSLPYLVALVLDSPTFQLR